MSSSFLTHENKRVRILYKGPAVQIGDNNGFSIWYQEEHWKQTLKKGNYVEELFGSEGASAQVNENGWFFVAHPLAPDLLGGGNTFDEALYDLKRKATIRKYSST